jgi:hypothetical protein
VAAALIAPGSIHVHDDQPEITALTNVDRAVTLRSSTQRRGLECRLPRASRVTAGIRTAGVLLAALTCVACGSGDKISTAGTEPTLLVHDVRGRSDDAEITGYVRYLAEADCFVLDGSGGVRHVVVWPPGTTVWLRDGAVAGVEVPGRDPIPLGSRLTGAGGFANPETSELDLPEVATDCRSGDGEFAMIHKLR